MEKKSDNTTKVITLIIGIFCLIFLIVKVAEIRKERKNDYLLTNTTSDTLIIDTSAISYDTTTVGVAPKATKWKYVNTTDEMTNKTIKLASIEANDLLYFDFPYDGGVTATFTVRKKGKNIDIILRVSEGQFMDTTLGGSVMIKFDSLPARKYEYVGATDSSSDVIFIRNESKILNALKKSKKMLIQATFYNNGEQVMTFDTENLEF